MVRQVPLSRGLVALVDDDDYEVVMAAGSWYADPDAHTTYARRNVPYRDNGGRWRWRTVKLHRFLTGFQLVDHINGDGLDNRRANLRRATPSQNARNRRVRSDSQTGFKGVKRLKSGNYTARIQLGAERKSLGTFPTPELAAAAYDDAAIRHFGAFARTNFPMEDKTT